MSDEAGSRSWRGRLLSLLYLLVATLVLLEVSLFALEGFLPPPSFQTISVTSFSGQYRLSENRRLVYEPVPKAGSLNEYGHMGRSYRHDKPKGTTRMLFIGDSVTEGLGVHPRDRFTERLEKTLGEGTEVVNLGVRGYNLEQIVVYLRYRGLSFAPDVVCCGICFNDLFSDSDELNSLALEVAKAKDSSYFVTYYAARNTVEQALLKLRSYRHAKYHWLRWSRGRHVARMKLDGDEREAALAFGASSGRMAPERVTALVAELVDTCRRRSLPLVLVLYPCRGPDGDLYEIAEAAKAHGVPIVDVHRHAKSVLTDDEHRRLFFEHDPCHLSVSGHLWLAEVLAQQLPEAIAQARR